MHSLMRAGNSAMPTTLEYCQHYMGAVETQLMTIFPEVGFIVKTSHRASGYGRSGLMAGGDLHEITSILNKKGWAKKTKLSRTERELGAAFCARAGQSRPQQANRSFTCLSKPGTLTFGAWRNVIPVPERPGDERNPPVLATDVQWCAGDVVVISRGGGGVVFVLDEEVCFSDNLVRGLPCRELLQRGHYAVDLKKKGSSLSKTEIRIHISNVRILVPVIHIRKVWIQNNIVITFCYVNPN